MTRYYTDFSRYTVDVQPAGWTDRVPNQFLTWVVRAKAGATGGNVLENTSAQSTYRGFSLDAVDSDPNKGNAEVVMRVRAASVNGGLQVSAVVRGSASANVIQNAYIAGLATSNTLKMYKIVSGTVTEIGSVAFTWAANTWYWVRLRAEGSTITARAWADGSTEPGTWQITVTNTEVSTAGWVGVGGYSSTGTNRDFDIVGMGTNGATAPSTTILEVATDPATNIVFNGATLNGTVVDLGGAGNPTRSFEYGLTTAYGSTVSAGTGGLGAFSAAISGLQPQTTYHYRTKAVNGTDTVYGADRTFTTPVRPPSKPLQLSPQGVGTWPYVSTTFSWQLDDIAVQNNYELQYRQIGATNWITTGTIASGALQHVFPANTFVIDTNYEWQVKSWDSANPSFYQWSDIVPFSTFNPPTMTEINPAAGVTVQLGIINVSAKMTSMYGRNSRLKVLYADNPSFTSAQSFQTGFLETGQTGSIAIGFTKRGTIYLKITAEDTEGLFTETTYSVNVIHTLYFISEPSVQFQAPQATHVTVRVSNSAPVVEYTAFSTPEPTVDKRIERLVEIDAGTQAVCQSVAQQLVARWGREQKSVSGDINLTVTLDFKEKVRIIIPQADVDEEMILQQKQHQVTDMITSVTLGDILLDDSELLARILDELLK